MSRSFPALLFGLLLPLFPFLLRQVLPLESGVGAVSSSNQKIETLRTELLMALDLLVRSERALREDSTAYTKALGRVPDVMGAITQFYRVEIARAGRDRLLVLAMGESQAKGLQQYPEQGMILSDRVSIDDEFRLRTNFVLPNPPRDYLHVLAQTVLNQIFKNQFQIPEPDRLRLWEGLYAGFFRYEERAVSQGGRTLVAIGLRAPVKGDIVEMKPGANLFEWVYQSRHSTWVENEMAGSLEKVYLAQKIHQHHVGSYAPNFKNVVQTWNELSGLSVSSSGSSESTSAPFVLQELQLDPTFGFHAELVARAPAAAASAAGLGVREPSSNNGGGRAWAINGYGQLSEVSSIEGLLQQFEQTRKQLDPQPYYNPWQEAEGAHAAHARENMEKQENISHKPELKPLLFDLVPENEK